VTAQPTRDPYIPDLVSLTEAGTILAMTKQGVHKRWSLGQLPGVQVGQAILFRRALIEEIAKAELGE
jgi:hypothetical protein